MLKSVQETRKSGTYRIVCYASVKYNILPLAGNWRISLRVFPTHNNLSAKQVGRCRCRSGKDRLTSNDWSRVQSRASFLLIFGEKETSGETEKRKITILFSFHFSCTDGFVGKKRLVHSRSNMLGKAILLPPSNSERSNSQIKKAMLSAEQRRFSLPLDGQNEKNKKKVCNRDEEAREGRLQPIYLPKSQSRWGAKRDPLIDPLPPPPLVKRNAFSNRCPEDLVIKIHGGRLLRRRRSI